MKTKEEILDEKTEDWNLTMSSASRVIALEAMEEYADEVSLGKTLQIHARDQQIEKYKELIEWLNDECPAVSPPLEPYTTADLSHDFAEILRSKLDDLKTELGL